MQVTTDAEAYAVHKQGPKPIPVAKKDNKKAKNDNSVSTVRSKAIALINALKSMDIQTGTNKNMERKQLLK